MSKIDEVIHTMDEPFPLPEGKTTLNLYLLDDEPPSAFASYFWHAVEEIENEPLRPPIYLSSQVLSLHPEVLPPWIPTDAEIESVKEDLEESYFSPRLVIPTTINITFTLTFGENFETELAELDRKDAEHEGPRENFEMDLEDLEWASSDFEIELECLDYDAHPDSEPEPGTLEWKLWALDHDISLDTYGDDD